MNVFVTILHRIDRVPPFKSFFDTVATAVLRVAYTYEVDSLSDANLDKVWRDNNAVDGTERNVQAGYRSLSVGDVVVVTTSDGKQASHAVAGVGFDWVPNELVTKITARPWTPEPEVAANEGYVEHIRSKYANV